MYRFILICVLIGVSACKSRSQEDGSLLNAEGDSFGINDIKSIIAQNPQMRTGADFLEKLPESLRSKYTVIHTSRSMQAASHKYPRIILFTDKFFLTFNGHPKARGYDRIEMMEYDKTAHKFNLAELKIEGDSAPSLSENPQVCAVCHAQDARALWNPYPQWPGAYDHLDQQTPGTAYTDKAFKEFAASATSHARYKSLINVAGILQTNPSRELANALERLTTDRIRERLLTSTKNYDSYKYLVGAVSRKCESIESFIPPQLLTRFARNYIQTREDLKTKRAAYNAQVLKNGRLFAKYDAEKDVPYNDPPLDFSESSFFQTAALRFILERDGGSIAHWFTTIDGDAYRTPRDADMYSLIPYTSGVPYDCQALKQKSLEALNALMNAPGNPVASNSIKSGKLEISTASLPNDQFLEQTYVFVARNCAQCHQGNPGIPEIPFQDPTKLASMLRANANLFTNIQTRISQPPSSPLLMPPGSPITDVDIRNGFIETLKQLKGGTSTSSQQNAPSSSAPSSSAPSGSGVFTFTIKPGTGSGPWNTKATKVSIKVGTTLRIKNNDSVVHILHTPGSPCPHGTEFGPGESYDCVTTSPLAIPATGGPDTYDHNHGSASSPFWLEVKP